MDERLWGPPSITRRYSPYLSGYSCHCGTPITHSTSSHLNRRPSTNHGLGSIQEAHIRIAGDPTNNEPRWSGPAENVNQWESVNEGYQSEETEDEIQSDPTSVLRTSDDGEAMEFSPDQQCGDWTRAAALERAVPSPHEEIQSQPDETSERARSESQYVYETRRNGQPRQTGQVHYHVAPLFNNTKVMGNIFVINNVQDGLEAFKMAMAATRKGEDHEDEQASRCVNIGAERDDISIGRNKMPNDEDETVDSDVRSSQDELQRFEQDKQDEQEEQRGSDLAEEKFEQVEVD